MQNRKAYALHIDKLLADSETDTTNESNNALKCACTSREGSGKERGRVGEGAIGVGRELAQQARKSMQQT